MKGSYDERFYQQEVLGDFLNVFAGQVYYTFESREHVKQVNFDPSEPLFWSLDFNVNAGLSVLAQRHGNALHVVDEIFVPTGRGTEDACELFFKRIEPWLGWNRSIVLYVYGDATGCARDTTGGLSDWDIIRQAFRNVQRVKVDYRVPKANPAVRDRVNAVNALLRNAEGVTRLVVDPNCTELIKDLEQVHWKATPSGKQIEMIDHSDPMRTHASDALGYLIAKEFPYRAPTVTGRRLPWL